MSLSGGVVDAGTDMANSLNRAGDVQDDRLKALYINKAKDDLKTLGKDFKEGWKNGVSLNVGMEDMGDVPFSSYSKKLTEKERPLVSLLVSLLVQTNGKSGHVHEKRQGLKRT
ncbi:hypothetical protein, partial [Sporomusa acidovorans]